MRALSLFVIGAVSLVASGCTHVSGGTAPSTVPLAAGSYREIGPVRGQHCLYNFLGLIPVTPGNETHKAVADALAQAPEATALVNVSADTFSQYFIIVSRTCTQVHGTAVAAR